MRGEQLRGAERVLALADRMRAVGGSQPHRLYHECTEAFKRDEIPFDQVTVVYRHAMIHSGAIVPVEGGRFRVCPECEQRLGMVDDGV